MPVTVVVAIEDLATVRTSEALLVLELMRRHVPLHHVRMPEAFVANLALEGAHFLWIVDLPVVPGKSCQLTCSGANVDQANLRQAAAGFEPFLVLTAKAIAPERPVGRVNGSKHLFRELVRTNFDSCWAGFIE